MEKNLDLFIEKLASKNPTPGGGGVAGLCGSMGAALASMVCNLTIGKPKYKEFDEVVKNVLIEAENMRVKLLKLAEMDEIAFEPLSKAYSLPTGTDEEKKYKDEIMEKCTKDAADVPLEVVKASFETLELLEKLVKRGSKLAISDVGVGAVVCKSALQSAALNVYINTKCMKNREVAERYNYETEKYVEKGSVLADRIYSDVTDMLK